MLLCVSVFLSVVYGVWLFLLVPQTLSVASEIVQIGAPIVLVVLQIVVFRSTRRRLFRMAPFHHHFELAGWAETTVIIRFWVLGGITCMFGVGLFYADWLQATGATGL